MKKVFECDCIWPDPCQENVRMEVIENGKDVEISVFNSEKQINASIILTKQNAKELIKHLLELI